ncbi:MAG: DJ-1/PfpI family protein [Fimbriimonadaceae bacterium]
MSANYDLTDKKIAVLVATKNTALLKEICDFLHTTKASLTAVTPQGQEDMGWDAGKAIRIDLADSGHFDAVLIITDREGNEKVMDCINADHFLSQFVEERKPISAVAGGPTLLGQLGLLTDREVSCDQIDRVRMENFGAILSPHSMTTQNGLTTADSSMSADEFARKVAEEVKEGRQLGQRA